MKKYTFYTLAGVLIFSISLFFFLGAGDYSQEESPVFTILPELPRAGDPLTITMTLPPSQLKLSPQDSSSQNLSPGTPLPYTARLVTPNKQILTKGSFFLYHTATEGKNDDPLITIAAVLVVPYTYTTQKEVNVQVLENETFIFEQTIQIAQRNFVTEMIPLDRVNTELRLIEDPQKTKEAQDLWELLTTYSSTTIYEEGLFILPVTSQRRTSFFGDRRTYLYSNGSSDTSIHGGIDFGIPQGTPVVACANGRVVFAGPRIVTGMTIAIEHMPGVFSLYYHLKDISVHPDMIVSKGEQIGFSGATGLATGPHLHWEIRIHGEFADPDVFTKRLILNGAF